jgi:hypothetical protein
LSRSSHYLTGSWQIPSHSACKWFPSEEQSSTRSQLMLILMLGTFMFGIQSQDWNWKL